MGTTGRWQSITGTSEHRNVYHLFEINICDHGTNHHGPRLEYISGESYPSFIFPTGRTTHLTFESPFENSAAMAVRKGFRILVKTYGKQMR